jgi:hypothetical protein
MRDRAVLPTVTGFAACRAIAALRKQHVPIAPLLQSLGLSARDIGEQHGMSALAQGKIVEICGGRLYPTMR